MAPGKKLKNQKPTSPPIGSMEFVAFPGSFECAIGVEIY
jgi:hypothetical protein